MSPHPCANPGPSAPAAIPRRARRGRLCPRAGRSNSSCGSRRRPAVEPCEVDKVRNVSYYARPRRRAVPPPRPVLAARAADFPVVVLVHGGAWMVGDKNSCGLYASVGEFLARNGIGGRPAQLPPLARGQAPRTRQGRGPRLRLDAREHRRARRTRRPALPRRPLGRRAPRQPAGDATRRYSRAHRARPRRPSGASISVSGVYRIPPGWTSGRLGGPTADAFRRRQVVPVRAASPGMAAACAGPLPGLPLEVDPYCRRLRRRPAVRRDASPIYHARPGLPPFLLVNAEDDLPTLPGDGASNSTAPWSRRASRARCAASPGATTRRASCTRVSADDPVGAAMLAFIAKHEGA